MSMEEQSKAVVRMRSLGESLKTDVLVEDDLMTGEMRWANAPFLEKTGYTLEQLSHMTAYSMIPERLHEDVRERLGGKRSKYFIVPLKSARGDVTWWFAHDVEEIYPLHWAQGHYLTTTAQDGPSFDMMVLFLEITNASGELFKTHEEVHDWVRGEIGRLDSNDSEIRKEMASLKQELFALRGQVAQSAAASRDAANHSLRASQAVTTLSASHAGLENRVSTEILRLIGTDALYEKQIVDMKAQLSSAASRATHSIQAAAQDAGKTISFKITFPVGVVAGVGVIVNYLINHPELVAKLLGLGG